MSRLDRETCTVGDSGYFALNPETGARADIRYVRNDGPDSDVDAEWVHARYPELDEATIERLLAEPRP